MRNYHKLMTMAAAVWFAQADMVFAGMPSVTLTDLAALRLQNLSFFLLGFFISALFIQMLWNGLSKDWAFLPRLTYPKALGVVFLWGLLFVLVLTMISGARELMTPGAWQKQGLTYKLAEPPDEAPETPVSPGLDSLENLRKKQLVHLRSMLWKYADQHQGHFPPDLTDTDITEHIPRVPDLAGSSYLYVKGLKAGQGAVPLAFEPELFGPQRLVLLANGDIRRMDAGELNQSLALVQP